MDNLCLKVKAPGKLMIAGEYAVLEKKQKSIVIAVNRYITAEIEKNKENSITILNMDLKDITWHIDKEVEFNIFDSRLEFIKNAIFIAIKYLKENSITLKKFKLKIESELNDDMTNKKYGLGSSAAIVVSVISAILSFHSEKKVEYSLDDIFKLSVIAHLKTQKSGSGADIAAAVYGGWIEYSAFDGKWVLDKLYNNKNLMNIIKMPWSNLLINKISPPESLKLVIGWTKKPAKTAPMIEKLQQFKQRNRKSYNNFLRESSIAVDKLIYSFNENNYEKAIDSLMQNRKALQKLSYDAKMNIETDKLKDLCDIAEKFGSSKSSGAGGGDCGIAFIKSEEQVKELYKLWKENDIIPLNLKVSKNGVSINL